MDKDFFLTHCKFDKKYYQQNQEILLDKAPYLAFSLLSANPYPLQNNQQKEVNVFCGKKALYPQKNIFEFHKKFGESLSLHDTSICYVYGLGLGYAYPFFLSWLKEKKERKLVFIEEDSSLLHSFLHIGIAKKILEDEQVDLILQEGSLSQLSTLLSKKYPSTTIQFFFSPYVRQNKKRKEFEQKLYAKTTIEASACRDRLLGWVHFSHFTKNVRAIEKAFCINQCKNKLAGIPAIICGAGPSLDEVEEELKNYSDKAVIFACGSAITALSKKNIPFHFGVAMDPNEEEYHRLKQAVFPEIPFLFSLRLHPLVLQLFHPPLGYFSSIMGQIVDIWLAEEMSIANHLIGKELSVEALSVTTAAMALAHFLGCNPIIFCGVDLAYSNKKHYCKEIRVDQTIQPCKELDDKEIEIEGKNGKLVSCIRWKMEKEVIEKFAKAKKTFSFFDSSAKGVSFSSIPYRTLPAIFSKEDFIQKDISSLIHAITFQLPLINQSKLQEKTKMLFQSLQSVAKKAINIASHLQKNQEIIGKMIIEEMELKEEIAYKILFYDIFSVLKKSGYNSSLQNLWQHFSAICQSYLKFIK